MKLPSIHDPALGLFFEPYAVTYTVPISMHQFGALRHCDDDDDRGGFSGGSTLWDDVLRATPITHIDYHGPNEKPCIKFYIPADKLDKSVFADISAAIWALLDACVAKREKDMVKGENT